MTVSRGLKKEISEELGDALVDLARLADSLEAEEKHAGGFLEWFGTVEKQVETMSDLTKEIRRMLPTGENTPEGNPLKAVKTLSPCFHTTHWSIF